MSERRAVYDARAVLDAACSEADLMAAVVALARLCGWSVFHPFDSRRSAAGFPDLTLVRDGRLVFVETKREEGRLTVDQQDWLCRLALVPGVLAVVWRPSDWSNGEIERELQRTPVATDSGAVPWWDAGRGEDSRMRTEAIANEPGYTALNPPTHSPRPCFLAGCTTECWGDGMFCSSDHAAAYEAHYGDPVERLAEMARASRAQGEDGE